MVLSDLLFHLSSILFILPAGGEDYNNNVSLGPKGCPRKKLKCDFWGRGQNPKVQIAKIKLKDILNNVESNYKAKATATFSTSALISEICAPKANKCWYFWNKGPNKKVYCAKKS